MGEGTRLNEQSQNITQKLHAPHSLWLLYTEKIGLVTKRSLPTSLLSFSRTVVGASLFGAFVISPGRTSMDVALIGTTPGGQRGLIKNSEDNGLDVSDILSGTSG